MSTLEAQVLAVRRSGGLFETAQRAVLKVCGKDRSAFLHRILSHDIKGLRPGQGRPACLLDRQAKIQFAGFVHAHPDALLLELTLESASAALAQLGKYLVSEDVQLSQVQGDFSILPLHGPKVLSVLAGAYPELKIPESPRRHTPGEPDSGIRFAARTDLVRLPGVHLWVDPQREEQIRRHLTQTGAAENLVQASAQALETLRIEAGVPWPGKELTGQTILNELGDEDWVSFNKGCFIGQEIVARIKYRAHPPRLLKGFVIDGDTLPALESPLKTNGEILGRITSACFSPTLKKTIALGFLKYDAPKDPLTLETPAGPTKARVTPLPFVA